VTTEPPASLLRRLNWLARDPQAARRAVANRLIRLAERITGSTYIALEYPPAADSAPRFGWDRPAHPQLVEILAQGRDTYAEHLGHILSFRDELLAIGRDPTATEPGWIQEPQWLWGLDCASLYTFMRDRRPARYVEVGSGNSTKFVVRARRDGGLSTHITSIDPHPRAEIDQLCDHVVRAPLERAPTTPFSELAAGDIVFFDGSHRVFTGSDATVFFLEILPALAPGVVICVHDILLPWDYPPWWARRFYSEQYLLASHLLAPEPLVTPLLAGYYVGLEPELSRILEPLWAAPQLNGVDPQGFVFWMEKR
jgi:hypothetical protein